MHAPVIYSLAELELAEYFGFKAVAPSILPTNLYPLMIEKAFLDNDQGFYAMALKAGVKAMNSGTKRQLPNMELNPEYEAVLRAVLDRMPRASVR